MMTVPSYVVNVFLPIYNIRMLSMLLTSLILKFFRHFKYRKKGRMNQKVTKFLYDSTKKINDHIKLTIQQAATKALGEIEKKNEYNLKIH